MKEKLNKYNVNFPAESKVGTVDCSTKTVHNHYYGMAKKMKTIFLGSIFALAIVVAIFIVRRPLSENTQLSIENFEPIPIDKKKGGAILKGVNFYNNKKFSLALKEFDASKDTSDFIIFYKANCLLYLTQSTEARQYLDNINKNNMLFKDEVEWLKALSYYYEEKIPEAIVTLTEISGKKHKYKDEASGLLIEIYKSKRIQ